ncbi:MAG: gamma-glutamyltransferase [Actinobacteria bacterium]|nr:gamma-glutamyltransferase [Actinomycetota bacterium]
MAPRFPRACVATPHFLASAAGLEVLAGGGNALDAAIAANLTLGVVAPHLCGYGGDLFALVWDGAAHGYLGGGAAPLAATVEAVRDRAGGRSRPRAGSSCTSWRRSTPISTSGSASTARPPTPE